MLREPRKIFRNSALAGILFFSLMVSRPSSASTATPLPINSVSEAGRYWLAGLDFLIREGQRKEYLELQERLLKEATLASEAYRWLLEREVERRDRESLLTLAMDIKSTLCETKSRTCRDFRDLWDQSLSSLLFYEASPPKLFKIPGLVQEKNCREALSVLKEVERSEGRCIPVLEAWVLVAECQGDATAVSLNQDRIRKFRGLENAD
jgi:hypothetical protein